MIYIVRHGETNWNKEKIIQGSENDEPLNEVGLNQARELAEFFSEKKLDLIISSPLKRARQTSNIVAKRKNLNVICDKNFAEIYYGDWSGKKSSEIPVLFPKEWENFLKNPETFSFKNGESIQSLYNRTVYAFENLDKSKTILVVTHTNPIRMIIAYVLSITVLNAYKLHFENCAISKLSYKHKRWEVNSLNCKIT